MERAQREAVLYEPRGRAVWLTINRPDSRNALNEAVIDGLLAGLGHARDEQGARCVVLTGAGDRAFCAGADLTTTMSPQEAGLDPHDRRGRMAELLLSIIRHPLPVLARVNGAALAGGLGLMLACDLAVAADDVQVGTPEVNLGLWPFMVSAVVRRVVPRRVALEMMVTGRRYSAAEAERWGMVNRVVPRDSLDGAIDELVGVLASKSPVALRLGKESFWRSEDMGLEASLAYLNEMLTLCLQSEDVVEGVSAFLEKRPPNWKGR